MSERLEQIEVNWKNGHVNIVDFEWLIQEAKRAKELDKKGMSLAKDFVKLKEQNQRQKQILEEIEKGYRGSESELNEVLDKYFYGKTPLKGESE